MSMDKWTAHFQRMQDGQVHPQHNGIWRLKKEQTAKPRVTRKFKNRGGGQAAPRPKRRIKAPVKRKPKQSIRKPPKKKKKGKTVTSAKKILRKTAF